MALRAIDTRGHHVQPSQQAGSWRSGSVSGLIFAVFGRLGPDSGLSGGSGDGRPRQACGEPEGVRGVGGNLSGVRRRHRLDQGIRASCPAATRASAMAIITAKAGEARAPIFAMPRTKCISKPCAVLILGPDGGMDMKQAERSPARRTESWSTCCRKRAP